MHVHVLVAFYTCIADIINHWHVKAMIINY